MHRFIHIVETYATAGSQSYESAGSFTFTVPNYQNNLIVKIWGGGGGGPGAAYGVITFGSDGGDSSFDGAVIAGGGKSPILSSNDGGLGGTYSGGDSGQNGSAGSNGYFAGGNGAGGSAGNTAEGGGAGGASPGAFYTNGNDGSAYGGGGSAAWANYGFPGAGGGAYVTKEYAVGDLTPTDSITVVVGSGGAGGVNTYTGGSGADGAVLITWS